MEVADPSCPGWPLSEFVDATFKPAEETDDGMESYRMSSEPCGLAVIINNKVFTVRMKMRQGADQDAENLSILFTGLGYNVKLFVDLTAANMLSTLKQVADLDH